MNSSRLNPAKIQPLSALRTFLSRRQRSGRKVVFTNGCFDILHTGHTRYLQKARALGDLLVVGVNTDASVRKIKGPQRPVNSEKDRAEVLAALSAVDFVLLFPEPTPEKTIRALRPDFLVKGGDWKKKDIVGASFVESYGGKVRTVPYVKGFSTTGLLEKIARL